VAPAAQTAPGPYDLITAWDSIWHVPLQKQAAVLLKLCHALAEGVVIIFSDASVSLRSAVEGSALDSRK
jgi:hypothetical protein